MTNNKILLKICEERGYDVELLTYKQVLNDYAETHDAEGVEEFCGREMSPDEVCWFICSDLSDTPSFVFMPKCSDISDDDAQEILDYCSDDEDWESLKEIFSD